LKRDAGEWQTMTAYQQPASTTATEAPAVVPRRKGNMVVKWITSTDHKTIGYMYLIASFVFFCLGGVMGFAHPCRALRTRHAGSGDEGAVQPALHHARHSHAADVRHPRCSPASPT
jgi:hypothetical protein